MNFVPIFVVGSTGVGKSDFSIEIAKKFDSEIINCDSMQQYRGMDIGTAKVSSEIRLKYPHHLIDNLSIFEKANIHDYLESSRNILKQVLDRKKIPIIVGGTMMYYQALIDNWQIPETNSEVKKDLELKLKKNGIEFLHQELKKIDSDSAEKINSNDSRRILRALEVFYSTGKKFVATQPNYDEPYLHSIPFGLTNNLPDLDLILEKRLNKMFDLGFLEEVFQLKSEGLESTITARKAIGYQQILKYFNNELTIDEAKLSILQATKRYVRRQRSWFKRDPRITWIENDDYSKHIILSEIEKKLFDGK